jgi:hypothetical protein
VQAEEILDQVYDPLGQITVSSGVSASIPKAQTFTVGPICAGEADDCAILSRVDVFITPVFEFGDLLFDVRATEADGAPGEDDAQVLAGLTLPVASIPSDAGFVSFDVSPFEISVEPGDVLAVVLRAQGAGANTIVGWLGEQVDPYPDGMHFFRNAGAGFPNWTEIDGVDVGFRTFVLIGSACPWDLNGDDRVGIEDLLDLLFSFGPCSGCPADFDGDGVVGVLDLLALLQNFGPCPGSIACPWDVNGDDAVDHSDLAQVLGNLGPCDGCPEDVNGDGVVDLLDAVEVATHFGPCP